ncbi:MAG: hypothetical protein KatS3mg070_2276 [Meiothermus sp.]|jgi:hypothetical protein|uniref:Uncharacterized protein n=1 Tax=Meiothermus hypogaeus NBRC 106114 TaxID=1227553 RepID=A0A511QXW0_9DEIN|nr:MULTISPECIES: hypothetical protein [Meiothermus]GEM82219.1 hypothetical protein MHY01S_03850 [Meiothermus hypogaeus NBRC 106114]GIW28913.1 MAG: hypothetical protein KatS3mg070_2276 [Meiothermus sp.]
MRTLKNIEVLIGVLERLKGESPEFQEDALWKIGDFISEAVDEGTTLDEETLYEQLRAFHLDIAEMAAEE